MLFHSGYWYPATILGKNDRGWRVSYDGGDQERETTKWLQISWILNLTLAGGGDSVVVGSAFMQKTNKHIFPLKYAPQ